MKLAFCLCLVSFSLSPLGIYKTECIFSELHVFHSGGWWGEAGRRRATASEENMSLHPALTFTAWTQQLFSLHVVKRDGPNEVVMDRGPDTQ